jgi:tetratricopeptide (TPR) repeat protein
MSGNGTKCILVLLFLLPVLPGAWAKDNLRQGDAAFAEGNFTEAVGYYERALVEDKSPDVYISLGHAQSRLGNWEQAAQAYQAAIHEQKKEPSVELLRYLGRAQYMADRFEEALDSFNKARTAAPDSEDELWLARCFIQTHQWTRGQDMLLPYLRKNPQNTEALELLAYLFVQSDRIDEAISIHKELVKSHPAQMHYLFALAKAQTAAKYYDHAIETLEFAERLTPEQTLEANQLLADLYVNRQMYRQAAACYQKIILSSDSPSVEDYYRLGYSYFQIGEFLSAGRAFEKIRQLEPSDCRALLYLGHIAAEKGQTETARRYYLEAVKLNKTIVEPYLSLAELEMKNDRYEDAAEHLSQAIVLGEQSAAVYYNHVLALLLSGRLDPAKAAIKEALGKYPDDKQLNVLLERLIKAAIAD